MEEQIKSGKQLIDDFFSQIRNIENIDEKTVNVIVSLYEDGKLTDTNLQNSMQELLDLELNNLELEDE